MTLSTDDSMYNAARDDDDPLLTSCFRETLSVDCGPRHRIRVVTDWATSSSSSSSSISRDDGDARVEGSCSVDPRHCVLVATSYADLARQFCVGRRSCDGLRVTSRPCPRLRPADYQLLVFICVPGTIHPGQLSLLFSEGTGRKMSAGQSAVMLCGWGVKAGWLIPYKANSITLASSELAPNRTS